MEKVSDQLQKIATLTMTDKWFPCAWIPCTGDGDSCITKEENRPLTNAEKALGLARRPFNSYVPDNMCLACRVYWHVSVASNDAHRLECLHVSAAVASKGA